MVLLRVEQVGAVADHTHALQRRHQNFLVPYREKMVLLPARDDASHRLRVFFVKRPLGRGEWQHVYLLCARRQLVEHLSLAPPDQNRRKGRGHFVEAFVAHHLAIVGGDLVALHETPRGSEAIPVNELHDGHQLAQAVFQRRAGEHQRVAALQLLHRPRSLRIPVLDALSLVGDHEIRRPRVDQVEIAPHRVVVRDLEHGRLSKLRGTLSLGSAHHQRMAAAETRDLLEPLVLERGRAYDQHPFGVRVAQQDLRCGDGLEGFAQTHLVSDDRPPGPRREQRALPLIRV